MNIKNRYNKKYNYVYITYSTKHLRALLFLSVCDSMFDFFGNLFISTGAPAVARLGFGTITSRKLWLSDLKVAGSVT